VGAVTTIGPAFRMPEERFEEIGKICVESALEIRKKVLE
jgi:DNA-binding IclR family transcriptional regulator